ncbi:MAG: regulatory protein LuxR [Acidimicrobiales bacterium]|nr:regulatory protein LuxR [Acidimicrobiales bacterium]
MRNQGRLAPCPRCAELERKVSEVQAALEAMRTIVAPAGEPGGGDERRGDDDPLTTREWEILTLLALGRSNQAIADELYLSINTVKTHVQHAYRKVGVSNRVAAAVWLSGNGRAAPADHQPHDGASRDQLATEPALSA